MIEKIRKKLLVTNQSNKVAVINELIKKINSLDGENRDLFIVNIISADIAIILTYNLAQHNENLQRSILVCWEILSEHEYFYKNNVATSVIMKIIETGSFLGRNEITEQPILKIMTHTLSLIFYRAQKLKFPLRIIEYFDPLFTFIDSLNIKAPVSNAAKIVSAGNLFFTVLSGVDFATISLDRLLMIQTFYKDILDVISKIIMAQENNEPKESFNILFKTVVNICCTGINVTNEDTGTLSSDSEDSYASNCNERLEIFKSILDITCKTMLQIVIPNFKEIDESSDEFEDFLKPFVTSLTVLYEERKNTDRVKKFSLDLSIQGYLKYFLEKIKNQSLIDSRNSICKCLAYVLTDLANNNLSMDQWQDGLRAFCKFIFNGLISYAESGKLTSDSASADAVLFCIYFHYHATADSQMIEVISQMPLTQKILKLSVENLPQVPTVQIIWFLTSVWMLERKTGDSDKCLPDALAHLIEILEKVGVEKCYICYPALVVTALQNSIFPREIQHQVVKLWLKTDGDVHALVDASHRHVVVGSLINALKTGTKDVVERACKDLIKIAKDNNPNYDFMQIVWQEIPRVLITYKKENEHNLEGFLNLANKLSTDEFPVDLAIQCVGSFIKIFSRDDVEVDLNIKNLLITLTNKMFLVASAANDSRVVPSNITDKDILNKIRNQAFQDSNDDLSAACFKCLANIFANLVQFSTKPPQPLSVTSTELINALSKDTFVSTEAMMFLNIIFMSQKNFRDYLIIDFCQQNVEEDLYEIFYSMIQIHNNAVPVKWKFTFNCLTNFLIFIKLNYPTALYSCCDDMTIHLTIIRTIDNNYAQAEFFKFVNLWLEHGLQSHSSFVDGTFKLNRMKEYSQDNFKFECTFEKALKQLKTHIEKLDPSNDIPVIILKNLKHKISLLV
ncbi:uncharacterized protein LOC130664646 [Microplitis mediator]|uniref:uncharacterized protein LOC130664646 n=1 Tax=Microplitis mediator TaxID=375433 RepID=UPI0025528979|nr:uncharacterized protein LOC130664646 [Microplitis mediator]